MDENEIRVADAAGVQIRLRYIGATHEVEVLDASGRPKLKSVLREPVRFDGQRLVVNNRTAAMLTDGSSRAEIVRWSGRAEARPTAPPASAASLRSDTADEPQSDSRPRPRQPRPAEWRSVSSIVGDVLMVLGLLAGLGGVMVAAGAEGLTSTTHVMATSSHQLTAGVLIACVSAVQVAVVLLLRRVGSNGGVDGGLEQAQTTFA